MPPPREHLSEGIPALGRTRKTHRLGLMGSGVCQQLRGLVGTGSGHSRHRPGGGARVDHVQCRLGVYLRHRIRQRHCSEKRFLTLLCVLLIAAFLFKTLFGIWLNHVQSKFAFRVAHRMSGEVWLHHFSDSLERMRSKESGRVLTEINSWPVLFARIFITGGQLLINELVVMVLLAIGLTAYDPVIFLGVAGIIGAGGLLIRLITKRRLQHNSATIQRLAPTSSSLVQNAVRGFLELITFRAVQSVQRNYLGHTRELYAVHSRQMVLGIIPTRLYELLAVTALCGIIVLS